MKLELKTTDTPAFKQFSLNITFESQDEAVSLLGALNRSEQESKAELKKANFNHVKYISTQPIFDQICTALRSQNIKPWF